MKNRILVICIYLLTGCYATYANARKTIVSGQITNLKDKTISLNYQEYALLSTMHKDEIDVDEQGFFRVEILISSPTRAFLVFGSTALEEKFTLTRGDGVDTTITTKTNRSEMVFLYLQPGDKQEVRATVGEVPNTLQLKGRNANSSYYLNQEDWLFNKYADKHLKNYFSYVNYNPQQYLAYAMKRRDERKLFLQSYDKKKALNKHLKHVSEWTIYTDAVMARLQYPSMRKSYREDGYIAEPDYYSFLDEVKVDHTKIDKGIAYFYFLDYYLKESYRLSASTKDYFDFVAEKVFGRPLYEYYAFALRSNFKRKLYDKFNPSLPYRDIAKKVKEKYQNMEGMLEGNPAPSVSLQDTLGINHTFDKWKGQYIYIDFWATWCGPCIQEIPFLKELEHDYVDKNIVFVSISMDREGDRQKWVNFVREQNLTGEQVWLDKENNKAISTAFNILQIPRFVILDKEGRIWDVNAPRPSDKRLREILDALE